MIATAFAAALGASASYGESLLDAMHRRHPEISAAQIHAVDAQGASMELNRRWSGRSRASQELRLLDATGDVIGTVVLQSSCVTFSNAHQIANELARRIYVPAVLAEPDPFAAGAVSAPAAQALIDRALDRDPTIVTLAFHVEPPSASRNTIVASSFGRIGKPADADDEQVVRQGKTRQEITNGGKRVAIELPLLDSHGQIIGALSTSFKLDPGDDPNRVDKRAVALRDLFARRIPSLKALFRSATVSRQVGKLKTCDS